MYFKKFPKFLYNFKINGKDKAVLMKDITQNVRIRTQILDNITLYDQYDIKDGETPEIIAEKIYGSPEYHWVVMLCNQRFDYINDFPLSTYNLEQHITEKYGAGNEYNTHHWVDTNGNWVHEDAAGATSISNYQYEDNENEKKRRIKLISPELLQTILKNFKELI